MSTTYEVRVSGVIPERDLLDIGAVAITTEQAHTVLYGSIVDQAALHGLLERVRALGLEVLEVRRVTGVAPVPADEPHTFDEPDEPS